MNDADPVSLPQLELTVTEAVATWFRDAEHMFSKFACNVENPQEVVPEEDPVDPDASVKEPVHPILLSLQQSHETSPSANKLHPERVILTLDVTLPEFVPSTIFPQSSSHVFPIQVDAAQLLGVQHAGSLALSLFIVTLSWLPEAPGQSGS